MPHLEQGVLFDLFIDPGQREVPENQSLHLLALSSIKGVGLASLRQLYEAYPALSDVWSAGEKDLELVLRKARVQSAEKLARSIPSERERALTIAANELDELSQRGIRLIVDSDRQFPQHLRIVPGAPKWLFVQGNAALLKRCSSVAVVGTRDATPVGNVLTRQLCESLVRWGYVVVSGLADGIDTTAHRTVVELRGDTVGVLGTGINVEFPAGSMLLRERIVERGGAIVTEYFPDTIYSRQTFVQRNRIQAGLASAVIPVESRAKSGTAHTVRFAEEYQKRLIGVWHQRFGPHQRSEILDLLQSKGYPVCDLASEQGREKLRKLLAPFEDDAVPRVVEDDLLWRNWYGTALRSLRAAINARPPEAEAATWIKETVQRFLNSPEHTNGDQGGLF
jgi:DNA processing protein